jgi:DNA-directed RNA polymerase subunit RPC12/RpoP
MVNKFKYHCETCKHDFDTGKMITADGKQYERCPLCGSWNYGITNLSVVKLDNGLYTVDYDSPSIGITIFSSYDESEAIRVKNRLHNLKWDIFNKIILSGKTSQQVRLYLDKIPCIMNGYEPLRTKDK